MRSIIIPFIKRLFQTVSGYQVQGWRPWAIIFYRRSLVDLAFTGSSGALLTIKQESEVESSSGIYEYLRMKRLSNLLNKYNINLVIDVGANEGQFATEIRKAGYQEQIISFEPISEIFNILSQNATSDSKWLVINSALGRESGERFINIADKSVFSSFLDANDMCMGQFGPSSAGFSKELVTVQKLGTFLDGLLDSAQPPRICLKMDTQGFDLEVFAGLGLWLEKVLIIQSEISVLPIYQGMIHYTESLNTYEKSGFTLAGMFPVNIDESTLNVIEFDCIMINNNNIVINEL